MNIDYEKYWIESYVNFHFLLEKHDILTRYFTKFYIIFDKWIILYVSLPYKLASTWNI